MLLAREGEQVRQQEQPEGQLTQQWVESPPFTH